MSGECNVCGQTGCVEARHCPFYEDLREQETLVDDMKDFIKTLENDDEKIPAWLWEKRNELVERINKT